MILPLLFVPLQKKLSNNKEIVKILLARQKKVVLLQQSLKIKSNMGKIISIRELLSLRGLDVNKRIKVVRHKDSRKEAVIRGKLEQGNPYDWYRYNRELFIGYQSEQGKEVFKDVDYIVSFIGEQGTTARFVGVYQIDGLEMTSFPNGEPCYNYKMKQVCGFEELEERIIIDWGKGALKWNQWLTKEKDKEVIEITPGFDNVFPGYENVLLRLGDLQNIILKKEYPEWKRMLSSVNCIYVISDRKSKSLYVGSTYNQEGIWGRWKQYAETGGHGHDITLRKLCEKDPQYGNNFSWSILEILPLNISQDEAITIETRYKNKFGREVCSLNKN